MKRFVALIACIFVLASCLSVAAPVAAAEEIYYVVQEGQEVYLDYARMVIDGDAFRLVRARFLLPTGYTFKTTESTTDRLKVTYCGLTDCYVSTADMDKLTVSPSEVALPDITVKVDDLFVYRFVYEEGTAGKLEPQGSVAADAKLTYLGTYTYNSVAYLAVRMEGSSDIYYTLASHSNEAEINAILHPAANIVEPKGTNTDDAAATKDKEFTWVRFVLILGIIVPLISIVLMIVRPAATRRRAHREIYDNDDDYDGIDEV